MRTTFRGLLVLAAFAAAALTVARAWAQNTGGGSDDAPTTTSTGGGSPTTTTTTTYTSPYGMPSPGTDLYAGLPSSSRGQNGGSEDNFDLGQSGGSGDTIHGGKGGSGLLTGRAVSVPQVHTVRRGDTLWDLCDQYYQNPWAWPKVWSYNPQIQNPHWIYPGDQVRMRLPGQAATLATLQDGVTRGGFIDHRPLVPAHTIFLRDEGYIDDPSKESWGQLIGSREEQTMLSEGNRVYLQMKPNVDLRIGQLLTVYIPLRKPDSVDGARQPPGVVVKIKGTVKVDQWDPEKHIARAEIVESLDVIERGALIGPVGRRFDVVPPKVNDTTVWARVLTGIYPHVYLAENQVVFIDRGSDDGLEPGNRLFIVRRGDAWRHSFLVAAKSARYRMRHDSPDKSPMEAVPLEGNENDLPDEVVGELRVLRTRKYSSICMVSASHREIVAGDRAVAKKGY